MIENPENPAVYQIWQAQELDQPYPWRAMMPGHKTFPGRAAHFASREKAERYVAAVKRVARRPAI
jgi:hypothetical protein